MHMCILCSKFPYTKGSTAYIVIHRSERREVVPSWELGTGKPTVTLLSTPAQKHNLKLQSHLRAHAMNVPLQSTFLGYA